MGGAGAGLEPHAFSQNATRNQKQGQVACEAHEGAEAVDACVRDCPPLLPVDKAEPPDEVPDSRRSAATAAADCCFSGIAAPGVAGAADRAAAVGAPEL